MLDLVVLRSMSDCDPDEWNAIDPHMGFDSRREWLHCAETLGTTVGAVMAATEAAGGSSLDQVRAVAEELSAG